MYIKISWNGLFDMFLKIAINFNISDILYDILIFLLICIGSKVQRRLARRRTDPLDRREHDFQLPELLGYSYKEISQPS